MAKLQMIVADDGTIATRIEKGMTYEQAREKIYSILLALKEKGIEVEFDDKQLFAAIEQHRHDGKETHVHIHADHLQYHSH